MYVCIYLFIYYLYHNAVSSSEYTELNKKAIKINWKEVECHGLVYSNIQILE
jgi:hypothetical protein